MKLRNKETGEIVECVGCTAKGMRIFLRFEDLNGVFKFEVNSLAELNKKWEDYEEPKDYWFVGCCGSVFKGTTDEDDEEHISGHKTIGNYFETKEEAEKALEKLMAWKRLEDKGFRFKDWEVKNGHKIFFGLDDKSFNAGWLDENIAKDLDLLFGGEDE